jgi:outer membrane protein OmpA-like peptidoglycan-associated protein
MKKPEAGATIAWFQAKDEIPPGTRADHGSFLPGPIKGSLLEGERQMNRLLAGLLLSALLGPAAYAQQASPPLSATPGEIEPGTFVVFFDTNRATLTPADVQVVAQAAEAYRQTGTAQVVVTGHTDTTGSAAYNLELSERRATMVADELIRQGVPATDITTVGRGEEDLLVPTADGVSEPRNRRVEIVVPQPPPAPVAEVPPPAEVEPAAPPEEAGPGPFAFTIGPLYGHNFGETDDGGENDLAGAQLTFSVLPGFLGGIALKQGVLWSFNGENDGLTGRSVAALEFAPDLGIVRPILAINAGGVYGRGVQDGFVVGPEIGLDITLLENVAMRAFAAYDYQFRNSGDLDEGILWGGLNVGVRF